MLEMLPSPTSASAQPMKTQPATVRTLLLASAILASALLGPAARAATDDFLPSTATACHPHPERLLVRFLPNTPAAAIADSAAKAGALEFVYAYTLVPDLFCLRVAPGTVDTAIKFLVADPAVQYAHHDSVGRISAQTTGYGINLLHMPAVWPAGRGSAVRLAVLDTGFDLAHPDLPVPFAVQSFVAGEAFDDLGGHGTHCAGIALARDNTIGVVGCAPLATLLGGKVCNNAGSFCATTDAMAGIDWAVTNGASVITMSFYVDDEPTQALHDTCDAAFNAGTLLVAAAGNSGDSTLFYPCSYSSVMAIAALDADKVRAGFSTFGPQVSLAAPGVGVLSSFLTSTTSSVAVASWNSTDHAVYPMANTPDGAAAAPIIDCGLGLAPADFPASVAGKLAHIRRGGGTFQSKAANAAAAGAVGVIISNNNPGSFTGSLNSASIPVVSTTQSEGDYLTAHSGIAGTLSISPLQGYAILSGTSMASPHVAGAAAAVLSCFAPGAVPPALLRTALETTAEDLGAPGRDDLFGHGLIRPDLAKAWLDGALATLCADFNHDLATDPDDLADFIGAYFTQPPDPRCDVNGDSFVDPDDLADFIGLFFGGCG